MDAFLTSKEKKKLQRMYENWNKYAKPDVLLERFYTEGLLHERDRADFAAKKTLYEKNEFLYDTVLNRSTYDRICVIRKILHETEDSGHKILADMLPTRPAIEEPDDGGMHWESYRQPSSGSGGNNYGFSGQGSSQGGHSPGGQRQNPQHNTQYDQTRYPGAGYGQSRTAPDNQHNEPYVTEPGEEDPKYAYGHQPRRDQPPNTTDPRFQHEQQSRPKVEEIPPIYQQTSNSGGASGNAGSSQGSTQSDAGHQIHSQSFMKSRYGNDNQKYKEAKPPTATVDEDLQPPPNTGKKLGMYPVRFNNMPKGKGLCAIFANFTQDLEGYENDIQEISKFFQQTLKYTVLGGPDEGYDGYRNLTAVKYKEKLRWLKYALQEGAHRSTDRLFIFTLSHGDEFGIKMMPPDGQDNSVRDRIKTEDIVNNFTHDHLPNLKGFPKCFFFQVCRGVELAKAANRTAAQADASDMDTSSSQAKSQVVAVGADTLVCHAAKEGTYSWVTDARLGQKPGSWFIQATIEVFSKYYKNEHVLDMMTEVNGIISKRHGKGLVTPQQETRQQKIDAYQIPAISNNLTKKLFLFP